VCRDDIAVHPPCKALQSAAAIRISVIASGEPIPPSKIRCRNVDLPDYRQPSDTGSGAIRKRRIVGKN